MTHLNLYHMFLKKLRSDAMPSPLPLSSQPPHTDNTVSDALLCAAMKQGSADALGMLYDRHAGLVYGIALKVLKNTQAAEDLTQDIFLALVNIF